MKEAIIVFLVLLWSAPLLAKELHSSDQAWGEIVTRGQLQAFFSRVEPGDVVYIDKMYNIIGGRYTLPERVSLVGSVKGAGFNLVDGFLECEEFFPVKRKRDGDVFILSSHTVVNGLTFTSPNDLIDPNTIDKSRNKGAYVRVVKNSHDLLVRSRQIIDIFNKQIRALFTPCSQGIQRCTMA